MGYRNSSGIGCAITLIVYIAIFIYMVFIESQAYKNINVIYILASISFVVSIIMLFLNRINNSKMEQMELDMRQNERNLKNEYAKKEREITNERDSYKEQIETLRNIMKSQKPFSLSASLYADVQSVVFDEASKYLQTKKHPANSTANEVKRVMKENFLKSQTQFKTISYKLEFLLQIFPDLAPFIEDEELLSELTLYKDYDNFTENRDRSRDYLTKEEWERLSVSERNQLAFDRWKQREKSKLVIGLLYEMYISYKLRLLGHTVEEYGIKHGVADLGRDIISHQNGYTYIIQCKRWSKNREIHENVICQLFGTTMEYKITHGTEKVKAVLISTTGLSSMASEFARRLGVEVRIISIGDFPMIKCNINGGNKIYHLPFDQQYWNTDISKPGEFYASDVSEAEKHGFRRAMRHLY